MPVAPESDAPVTESKSSFLRFLLVLLVLFELRRFLLVVFLLLLAVFVFFLLLVLRALRLRLRLLGGVFVCNCFRQFHTAVNSDLFCLTTYCLTLAGAAKRQSDNDSHDRWRELSFQRT